MTRELSDGTTLNVPDVGEIYYYIAVHPSFGTFYVQQTTWNEYGSDKRRLVKGNVYHMKKQAEAVCDKFNELLNEL